MLFKSKSKPVPQGQRDALSLYIVVTDIHVGRYRIGLHPPQRGLACGSEELEIVGDLCEYSLNFGEPKPGSGSADIKITSGPIPINEDGTFGEILFSNFNDPFHSPQTYLLVGPQILKEVIDEVRWRKPKFVRVSGTKSIIDEIGGPWSMRFAVFGFELLQGRM